jgi:DNA-binding PadR family transcriptional regulator
MYPDNSLIPTEAIRLAALGSLATAPKPYAALATEIRHFTGRIVGPSLDLIGPPIELLKVEGLVEAAGDGEDAPMRVTPAGLAELKRLLTANLRGPVGEFNKLVIALKLRFLDLLDRDGQLAQMELLIEVCERELTRLTDLRGHHAAEGGHLVDWLDHDIGQVEARLAWFRDLQNRL